LWYSSPSARSETLFRVLDQSVIEINSAPESVATNLAYEIEQIFNILRGRKDVTPIEIAKREYAYLPLLHFSQVPLTISSLLAEDPEFFVSVLCDVFKPSSGEAREPTEERRAKASAGFRLLSEFHTLPGLRGETVDEDALKTWVTRVRVMAAIEDRAAIADEYIGHILAHAPYDPHDKAWPHRAIRNLLESLAPALRIERGIRIERFNMRGPTTRGPFDGGAQERDLAAAIREWGKATVGWPRTTKMLADMAAEWEHQAEAEDIRAKQDEMRFS
jgi:hypothetical protein